MPMRRFRMARELAEACAFANMKLQARTPDKAAATLGRLDQTLRLKM
jgi:hypothetical protein